MKRVLVVAYYFPPIGGIGSIRMARFAEYLPEFGWRPTVLTPRKTPHPSDAALSFPEDSVVRAPSFEMLGVRRALSGGGPAAANGNRGPGVRAALRKLAREALFPDAQIAWYPGAVAAGLRAVRGNRFDAVYSSSFPITSHLIARTLTRHSKLPWIAEFRDPWSDRLPEGPRRRRAAALERAIAGEATQLIMPNPSLAAHFSERWGRKIAVVPNGCDALPIGSTESQQGATLTHVGTYYPDRQRLQGLWEAIQRLLKADPSAVKRIRFVGQLSADGRAELARSGLEHLLEETGPVAQEHALRLMLESAVLFSGGEADHDPIARGVVPAKLFEYLATDLPILYLGDGVGDAVTLLEGHPGCWIVDPADVDGIATALQRALTAPRYQRDVTQITRRARAAELADVLTRIPGR